MPKLKKSPKLLILVAASLLNGVAVSSAESVVTEPIGFNKITCLTNSDTIVGVPFRSLGSINTALSSAPVTAQDGESATLSLSVSNLGVSSLSSHYVKFNDGTHDGRWYDITGNTGNSVTIDLNGDNLTGVLSGAAIVIAKFWTLESLFPPAGATTAWTLDAETGIQVPNGHAIVASSSALNRRTEFLFPNTTAEGINLSSNGRYYITGGVWKKFGDTSRPDFGDTILYPDICFTIRHPSTVLHPTAFKSLGEVEMNNFTIFLSTRTTGKQDNFIGVPRPIPVKLKDLGLNDNSVFATSASALIRKDELLVFDNEVANRNRSSSARYYRVTAGWRKFADGAEDHDNTIIPAGAGFIIRKVATVDGASAIWQNPLVLAPAE